MMNQSRSQGSDEKMKDYLDIGIKLAIGIITLIFQMNLLGKANLAPTSPLDQLQNFVLGGIIGGMIYNAQISILQYFLVLVMWTFLVTLFKYLKENVALVKKMIDGYPTTLIKNGKVLVDECTKHGISATDLMFKLRTSNVYETRSVKRAIYEQNGQLTIILYGEENVKYPIITNGYINQEVLEMIERDESWLFNELNKQEAEVQNVYLGEWVNGELILSLYD